MTKFAVYTKEKWGKLSIVQFIAMKVNFITFSMWSVLGKHSVKKKDTWINILIKKTRWIC